MESLANKYRPKFLKDLRGQTDTVIFLSHLIKNNISRNIIFKGEYGTGKTTSARIYAKTMLCLDKVDGIDSCGKCESCKLYDEQSNKDYLEFDAASKGSIDNIRSLLDTFNSPPIFSKKKIWVIDEAHSMSPKAWDVLLKTIEEPKEFQIILFCTNYPDKIRPAILSRCLILELCKLEHEQSKELIETVAQLENLNISKRAVNILATFSNGHSRDILKNLEQLSYYGDITEANCRNLLFGKKYETILNLYRCLLSDNFAFNINGVFSKIFDFKKEFEIFLELTLYLKGCMLHQVNMTSLAVHTLYEDAEIYQLQQDIINFSKGALINEIKFFERLDDAIQKSRIDSIIGFKCFIYLCFEKLNIEKNQLGSSLKKEEKSSIPKRRSKYGAASSEILKDPENIFKPNTPQPISSETVSKEIDLSVQSTKPTPIKAINNPLKSVRELDRERAEIKKEQEELKQLEIEKQKITDIPKEEPDPNAPKPVYAHELYKYGFKTVKHISEFILL